MYKQKFLFIDYHYERLCSKSLKETLLDLDQQKLSLSTDLHTLKLNNFTIKTAMVSTVSNLIPDFASAGTMDSSNSGTSKKSSFDLIQEMVHGHNYGSQQPLYSYNGIGVRADGNLTWSDDSMIATAKKLNDSMKLST